MRALWVSGSVLGLVATLAAVGCGSSTSSDANPGGAGQAGASGASATSGGSGAGAGGSAAVSGGAGGSAGTNTGMGGTGGLASALGDSKTEGCIAYAFAECMRQEECGGFTPDSRDCFEATFGCPDNLLSAGSTRTAASLKACAPAFAAFSCAQLNVGKLPDCATPGTQAVGQPCDFGAQCSTIECNYSGQGTCGTCAKVGELGDDCSAGANTECHPGLTCISNQCAPQTAGGSSIRGEGEDCSLAGTSCGPNLYCEATTKLCAPSPTLGMSCASTHACQGSYCSKANQTCTAYPTLNQPCGVDDGTAFATWCEKGLVCSTTMQATGVCAPPPAIGQPCYVSAVCAASAFCDFGQAPAQCEPLRAAGESCQSTSNCQDSLYCLCPDGSFTCTTRTCNTVGVAGDPCGAPNVICHPGFTCTDGKCAPHDVKGTSTCVSP